MSILEPPALADLPSLPAQPRGVAWPTDDWWPTAPLAEPIAAEAERLLALPFSDDADPTFGETHAVVLVHKGRIVAERYGFGADASTRLLSWSMAKSVLHSLVGILVEQGRLDPDTPAPISEWEGDARSSITLTHLLRMIDGLDFNESYKLPEDGGEGFSHCIDMLFGAGAHDHAGYTIGRPATHPPGTTFNYSSGTSNIVARVVCDLIGEAEQATAWMREHLFDPVGMHSATPTYDTRGTFVGSSYLHMTARDWARFGLLHLRGGEWNGRQVVPRGWVEEERRTRAADADGGFYGTHWWTANDQRGTFWASGYEWQRVMCVPSCDLVAVRLGKTDQDNYDTPKAWFGELVSLFADDLQR